MFFKMAAAEKADILLVVTPPFLVKMPHIGVGYLSSFLKNKGYSVSVADLSMQLYKVATCEQRFYWQVDCVNSFFHTQISDSILDFFKKEIGDFVNSVISSKIRVIGFSVNIISIDLANKIAQMIKEKAPDCLIVFGGPGVYFDYPRSRLQPIFCDVCVIGEGELALLKIMDEYYGKGTVFGRTCLHPGEGAQEIKVIVAEQAADLDQFPFPTFSEFDLLDYNFLGEYGPGPEYKPLPLLFTRGCINRCTYCIDCIMWPKYKCRSPKHIMDEIRYHLENNHTTNFELTDLSCNGNLKQLSEVCDLIIESGLVFGWVSYGIIRNEMDGVLLAKMKKAGCQAIIYGVESGSDRILAAMGKRFTAKDAAAVIRRTFEAGIRAHMNIIVGFPGETEDDFAQTVSFIECNKDFIYEVTNVSGCFLFPDSAIGRNKKKYGVSLEEDADPMFFRDANNMGREQRNKRLARIVELINELGLSMKIINTPQLNPKTIELFGEK